MTALTAKDLAPFIGCEVRVNGEQVKGIGTISGLNAEGLVQVKMDLNLQSDTKHFWFVPEILTIRLRLMEDMTEEEMTVAADMFNIRSNEELESRDIYIKRTAMAARFIGEDKSPVRIINLLRSIGVDTEGWIAKGLAERAAK